MKLKRKIRGNEDIEAPHLQHPVRTGLDTRHHVRRCESNLLHLRKVINRIAVQDQFSDGHVRKFARRPHLQRIIFKN